MASIADVYVTVLPETGKIADGIKDALLKADKHVRDAARRWRREIEGELKGTEVKIDLKVDKAKAKKEIEDVAKDQTVNIEADAETGKAEAKLDAVARDRDVTINVNVSTGALARSVAAASGGAAKGGIQGLAEVFSKLSGLFGTIGGQLGGIIKQVAIIGAFSIAPNIVPAIGQVVAAVGQLSGLLGLLPGAIAGAALAFGTLKIATMGFADALKEIGDPKKFAEAIKQLSPAAQEAALSIQRLWPQLVQLRMTLQDSLFRGLGQQFEKLGNIYIPMFRGAMSQIAAIANRTFQGISDMLSTPEMQTTIQSILDNLSSAFNILGQAIQPFVHAITDILQVSSTFMPGLATTVFDLANRFSDFITQAKESGDLGRWIQGGIDAFTNLKDIVVNTWGILKGLFSAAAGPEGAGGMLTNLVAFTEKWNTWVNSPEGQNKISKFFADAKTELDKWWPIIRDLPGQLKTAFDAMKDAVQPLIDALGWVSSLLKEHPGLIQAVVGAFIGWEVITGVVSLTAQLAIILGFLGAGGSIATGAAATAAGISAAFAPLLVGFVIPVTISVGLLWATDQLPGGANAINGPGANWPRALLGPYLGDWINNTFLNGQPPPGPTPPGMNPNRPVTLPQGPGQGGQYVPGGPSGLRTPNAPPPGPPQAPQPAPPPGPQPVSPYQPPAPAPPGGGGGGGGGAGGTGGHEIAPSGFNWDAVMVHEGGTWDNHDTGHNGHYGGLQFSPETWAGYGGEQFASRADYATREEQMTVADRVAFYGWQGTPPQGLKAWEAITKGNVPGITTSTVPPRPTPQYGSALTGGNRGGGSTLMPSKPGGFPGGANVTYTPQVMQEIGIPPLYTNPAGGGAAQIPQWVQDFVKEHGGPSLVAQSVPHPGLHGAAGGPGWAVDVTGDPAEMDRLAKFLVENPEASAQLIHQSTITGTQYGVAGGQNVSGSYYGATYGTETDMVHWAPSGTPVDVSYPSLSSGQRGQGERDANDYGKSLGENIVSGMMEVFGLGDIFPDPTQFGLFKIVKAILGLKPGGGGGESNGGSTNADNGSGGGGNGILDWATSLIPNVAGSNNNTSVAADLVGGGGGSGGISDFASQFIPPGPQGGSNNNNGNFTAVINNPAPGADTPFIMQTLDNTLQSFKRGAGAQS